jgi:uncharacterized membrane protein YozB (DUF420 family)
MLGFLGTRGDLIVDVVMTLSGFLPAIVLYTFWIASKGKKELHKRLQIGLLFLITALVIALELDVRFSDLSEISKQSSYYGSDTLKYIFIVHLFFSITTFVGWIYLVIKSNRIYPLPFKKFNHKKWGKILFVDIILTVVTGWMMYILVFVY